MLLIPAALFISAFLCRPALSGWPESGQADLSDQPAAKPYGADSRCRKFGFNVSENNKIPVAWPLIMDLTEYGTLRDEARRLSDKLAEFLTMTAAFSVNNRDLAPVGGALSWISPIAFDYLGWRSSENWMVITGTIKPAEESRLKPENIKNHNKVDWIGADGDDSDRPQQASEKRNNNLRVTLSLSAYLTEEGNVLNISNSSATLNLGRSVNDFAASYVNAISDCITGIRGTAGTRIVYARKSNKKGTKEIWVTNLGSDVQRPVSSDGTLAMLPAWGPGGRIAWTGYRAGNPDLFLDGRPFGKREGMNTGVAWSPGGTMAAVTWAPESAPDIYLIDPSDGRVTKKLTDSPAIDASPAWSPDSRQIAFVSDRKGTPTIFTMNADGSDVKPLPISGEYNTGPDWSPDGMAIIYQGQGQGSGFSIWVYDISTRTSKKISSDRRNNEEPSWSPDGLFVTYTSTWDGVKKLYIMNRDGSGAHPVFRDDAEYYTPAWERCVTPIK